jgi:hypothetical protein
VHLRAIFFIRDDIAVLESIFFNVDERKSLRIQRLSPAAMNIRGRIATTSSPQAQACDFPRRVPLNFSMGMQSTFKVHFARDVEQLVE